MRKESWQSSGHSVTYGPPSGLAWLRMAAGSCGGYTACCRPCGVTTHGSYAAGRTFVVIPLEPDPSKYSQLYLCTSTQNPLADCQPGCVDMQHLGCNNCNTERISRAEKLLLRCKPRSASARGRISLSFNTLPVNGALPVCTIHSEAHQALWPPSRPSTS